MAGPGATLLRLLFPTWAFFERPHAPPLLEVLVSATNGDAVWQPAFTSSPRRWWNLFINPLGTLVLAQQTHVERLYELCSDEASREFIAAWRVVRNISERAVRARRQAVGAYQWRFRITVQDAGHERVVYESSVCP
jgi:hypothetical protein